MKSLPYITQQISRFSPLKWLIVLVTVLSLLYFWLAPHTQNSAQEEAFNTFFRPCEITDAPECALGFAQYFIGKPYISNNLESGDMEKLVVNFQAFDCVTLVENVLALGLISLDKAADFNDFEKMLQKLRYQDGKVAGYASRLHYFTDWIYDNQQKGLIYDVTKEIGGVIYSKKINYMTTHRQAYPLLQEDATFQKIKERENLINQRKYHYIPKEKLPQIEYLIQEGDILSITTAIEGLDVSHEGIAVKKGGKIHLLHASSEEKSVIVSKEPLYAYLMKHKKQTGIMVARLITK